MENTFRVGDPVWGKIKGFSAWPGKVILPPDGLKVLLTSNIACIKMWALLYLICTY